MSLFCKLLVVVLLLGGVSGTLNKTATKHLGDRYRHLVNKLFSPPHWNIQSTQAFEIITSHSAQPVAESVTESFRILCSDSLEKGLTLASLRVKNNAAASDTLVSVPKRLLNIFAVLRAEDTICFTTTASGFNVSAFASTASAFNFLVPAPLKVHKTVHSYLLDTRPSAAVTVVDDDFFAARAHKPSIGTAATSVVDDDFFAARAHQSTVGTAATSVVDDDFIASRAHKPFVATASASVVDDDFIASRAHKPSVTTTATSVVDDDFIAVRAHKPSVATASDDDFIVVRTSNITTNIKLSSVNPKQELPDYLSIIHGSHTAVADALSSLIQPTTAHHFDSFYWTAPIFIEETAHTHSLRGSVDSSLAVDNVDRATRKIWRKLARSIPVATESTPDPCDFLTLSIKHLKTKSLVSVKEMLSHSTGKSCLAHLVTILAQVPAVRVLSLVNKPTLLNYRSRSIQQSATVGVDLSFSPYTNAGLMGNGQVVSVADTGVDDLSCYFIDNANGQVPRSDSVSPVAYPNQRVLVQYAVFSGGGDGSDTQSGHGSFVSGTASGSLDTTDIYSSLVDSGGRYDGVAPGSKLAFLDLSTDGVGIAAPNTAAELFFPGYSAGARVHTNSWGAESVSYYSNNDLDQYLYDNMDFLALYSAGNSGSSGVTVEASAKNVVAVGSGGSTYMSASFNNVAAYSSYGTTYDDRLKPDIISPGDSIRSVLSGDSTSPTCDLTGSTGTSMASPGAAGMVALIRQYFVDNEGAFWSSVCNMNYNFCNGFNPSGVLTKAVLLHSGSAMLNVNVPSGQQSIAAPPSQIQGYGRVTLSNVLPLSIGSMDLFVDDLRSVSQGGTNTYTLSVADSSVPLKVTLSWFDPPAQDGSTGPALVDDLDLVVTDPSGNLYYGNGGESPDMSNNNEQVLQMVPMTGDWTVQVQGSCLPYQGSQLYSIVITSGGAVA